MSDQDATAVVTEEPQVEQKDLLERFEKMEKRVSAIGAAERKLKKWQNKVAQSTQAHKAATAQLKSDIGARDKAVVELQRIIDDVGSGQQWIPGTEPGTDEEAGQTFAPSPVAEGTAENWPISDLGTKQLKAIVGDDAIDAAKNCGDPIGLSDKQLEKLEAADWQTIGDLEKAMRENAWWWNKLAAKQDASIVTRVISTLTAFRKVRPMPVEGDEKPQTVLEKLAENNALDPASEEQPKVEPQTAA